MKKKVEDKPEYIVDPITDEGIFYDSYGTHVKHGDKIIIEKSYIYGFMDNSEAIIFWDPKIGMYQYHSYILGGKNSSSFHGIHKFKVKENTIERTMLTIPLNPPIATRSC